MADSVDSYINAQPEQAMSWDDYYNQYMQNFYPGYNGSADHWTSDWENFFTGHKSQAKSRYEAYLTNLNTRNEWLATQSARAWDKMMDDTKTQRAMKDYEAAGLNPYLLINSGSSLSSTPGTSAKADYRIRNKDKSENKTKNAAIILLAVARLAAALL